MDSNTPLIDAVGVEHHPVDKPARIVSLVPSITELLFALDLGTQVVGRTTFCIHPADKVTNIPRVGGTKQVRLERLKALSPTHVIVNIDENQKSDVDEIATFVSNVIVTHPNSASDNMALYRLLGGVFNRSERAASLCRQFQTALAAVQERAMRLPHKLVVYLIWYQPWMTISPPTYIAELLSLVNWITPYHGNDLRYPQLADSCLEPGTADLVLFSSEPFPFKKKHLEIFQLEFGVDRERLVFVDGEMTSWYGSRAIEGLGYLCDLAVTHA